MSFSPCSFIIRHPKQPTLSWSPPPCPGSSSALSPAGVSHWRDRPAASSAHWCRSQRRGPGSGPPLDQPAAAAAPTWSPGLDSAAPGTGPKQVGKEWFFLQNPIFLLSFFPCVFHILFPFNLWWLPSLTGHGWGEWAEGVTSPSQFFGASKQEKHNELHGFGTFLFKIAKKVTTSSK